MLVEDRASHQNSRLHRVLAVGGRQVLWFIGSVGAGLTVWAMLELIVTVAGRRWPALMRPNWGLADVLPIQMGVLVALVFLANRNAVPEGGLASALNGTFESPDERMTWPRTLVKVSNSIWLWPMLAILYASYPVFLFVFWPAVSGSTIPASLVLVVGVSYLAASLYLTREWTTRRRFPASPTFWRPPNRSSKVGKATSTSAAFKSGPERARFFANVLLGACYALLVYFVPNAVVALALTLCDFFRWGDFGTDSSFTDIVVIVAGLTLTTLWIGNVCARNWTALVAKNQTANTATTTAPAFSAKEKVAATCRLFLIFGLCIWAPFAIFRPPLAALVASATAGRVAAAALFWILSIGLAWFATRPLAFEYSLSAEVSQFGTQS